jgi:hypothetical protein
MPESKLGPLDAAATALLALGCADPFSTDPAIRVRCLWMAEQLRVVRAHAERRLEPLAADDVGDTIRATLDAFASLPPDLVAQSEVADAISALRAVETAG